jgi:hypothetical protein
MEDIKKEEIWKDVYGYERYYQASNLGNIKSEDMVVPHWRGGKMVKRGRILRNCKRSSSPASYLVVMLCVNQVKKTVSVHRVIAEAFIPNPENKPQVNHINGIKNDNRVENLEWVTGTENQIHAVKTGLKNSGNNLWNGKFSKDDIEKIKKLKNDGILQYKIAEIMGVAAGTISCILYGKTYRYI